MYDLCTKILTCTRHHAGIETMDIAINRLIKVQAGTGLSRSRRLQKTSARRLRFGPHPKDGHSGTSPCASRDLKLRNSIMTGLASGVCITPFQACGLFEVIKAHQLRQNLLVGNLSAISHSANTLRNTISRIFLLSCSAHYSTGPL